MEGCPAVQTVQRFGTAQRVLLLHRTVKRTVLLSLREQGDAEKTNNNFNILQCQSRHMYCTNEFATLDFY